LSELGIGDGTGRDDHPEIAERAAVAELQEMNALAVPARFDPPPRGDAAPRLGRQEIAYVVARL
jgi:hypothetical protein